MTLEEVSDRIEIDDLLTAYAAAVDAREWDVLAGLFADGAVLDYSAFDGPRAGAPEAIAWVAEGLSGFPVSQHLVTNRQVWLGDGGDPDAARARCEVFNPMVDANGTVVQIGGSYEDRLVRTPAGWRFAERVARPAWSTFGP